MPALIQALPCLPWHECAYSHLLCTLLFVWFYEVVIGLWLQLTAVIQEDDDLSLRLSAMKVHKSRLEHEKEQATQRSGCVAPRLQLADDTRFCWLHLDTTFVLAAVPLHIPCA